MRYQIVVNRKLLGYGQFVTEGRDEVNTTIINGEERPFIFASKLRAVERRTIMNKVREVLEKEDCFLKVHEKAGESGISGLCLNCPACWLFGGTYAPGTGKVQVNERTKVNYSDAYPLQKIPIEDKTFNAVDEQKNITGQALGVNQIIGPGGDFINVVDIETENKQWVELIVWGIEHSDRYGGNVRIYGQMKNEVIVIIKSDKLEVTSWELANNYKSIDEVKKFIAQFKPITLKVEDVSALIKNLDTSPEVKKLKENKANASEAKAKRNPKNKEK